MPSSVEPMDVNSEKLPEVTVAIPGTSGQSQTPTPSSSAVKDQTVAMLPVTDERFVTPCSSSGMNSKSISQEPQTADEPARKKKKTVKPSTDDATLAVKKSTDESGSKSATASSQPKTTPAPTPSAAGPVARPTSSGSVSQSSSQGKMQPARKMGLSRRRASKLVLKARRGNPIQVLKTQNCKDPCI